MAKVQARSGLATKLGNSLDAAVDAHKNDETTINAGGLPAGIEGGIAQLIECKFAQYKTGKMKDEFYFMAAAIVVEPKKFKDAQGNEVVTEGARTQIGPIPVCDTPGRTKAKLADHIATILNEFRKLGVDTKNVTASTMEAVAAALKAAKPYTKFRTWVGKPQEAEELANGQVKVSDKTFPNMGAAKAANPYLGQAPSVQHDWQGVVQYEGAAPALDGAVADNTAEAEAEPEAQQEEAADNADYAQLGADADGGDKEAQSQLQQLAEAQGIDADNIETWAEVAELVANGGGGDGSGTTTAAAVPAGANGARPANWEPKAEEPYFFAPAGRRKRVEGVVTTVFVKSRTVNIKNLDDNAVERSVSWDKLFDEGN